MVETGLVRMFKSSKIDHLVPQGNIKNIGDIDDM